MRDQAFQVPASGTVDYKHFVIDPGWQEDKYIAAAEARPDNKAVVHHILVYIIPPGQDRRRGGPRLDSVLVGYAPGSVPVDLGPGVALKVPAGSKLMFQMHYTPNGYAQKDRSYAGVKFMDKADVKQEVKGRIAINTDFRIPPDADDHVVRAEYRVRQDEMLVSMTPHMHLRGKSFKYEALYPDGRTEVLLDVPNYDFNWQLKYILDQPKLLPRGTTINCTATFDNSESNLVNPDPTKTVFWGDQSWEEMMIGFISTIPTERASLQTSTPSIDPTGSYQWKGAMPGELLLFLKGDAITGTLTVRGEEVPIEYAVMTDDQISFSVRSPEMPGVTLDFEATVADDAIRGNVDFVIEAVGKSRKFPWVAHKKEW